MERLPGTTTAAGNGRNNANRISILGRRVLFGEVANVFVIDVDVHKTAQLAVFGEQVLAQVRILGREISERFADRSGINSAEARFPAYGRSGVGIMTFTGISFSP